MRVGHKAHVLALGTRVDDTEFYRYKEKEKKVQYGRKGIGTHSLLCYSDTFMGTRRRRTPAFFLALFAAIPVASQQRTPGRLLTSQGWGSGG